MNYKGINQTVVRDNNIKMILKKLQWKDYSCSELANQLMLSKSALTKITTQMSQLDLIKDSKVTDDSHLPGRKKSYISINDKIGVVATVDFSSVDIKIAVYNLKGKCLVSKELIDYEFLTKDSLELVVTTIKKIFRLDILKNVELLSLCIGASGKINKYTGEIAVSPKFNMCKDVNLLHFFETRLNCKVLVQNDINLFVLAEQLYGSKNHNMENAIMIYIDSGLGGAILNNNKVILGDKGYAGEFGLVTTFDDDNKEKPYDGIVSINAIKDKIKQYQIETGNTIFEGRFRFKDVVKEYFDNNEIVRNIVNHSAEIVARLINNMIDVFDIYEIIIAGRIRQFNSEYLQIIKELVNRKHNDANVSYSNLNGNGVILGAVELAINTAFDILIERRRI